MARARKLREQQAASGVACPGQRRTAKTGARTLKAKMANASSDDVAALQKELADTNARLKQLEREGDSAQNLIATDVQSVCLLHVAVAFREKQSGRRLRYAGLNPQGEPLQDSDGNPILTTDGRGPEVKADIFGTGFLAGPDGRVVTNRHVAEPWWKDDEIGNITVQGFQPEISTIRAYFPGDVRAFHARDSGDFPRHGSRHHALRFAGSEAPPLGDRLNEGRRRARRAGRPDGLRDRTGRDSGARRRRHGAENHAGQRR